MADYITGLAALMRAEVDSLNSVAQNSSNVNTVGYKAERSAVDSSFNQSLVDSMQVVKSIDRSSGELKVTGRDFDFALMGDGWFAVKDTDGSVKLTRNGQFQLNSDGVLVNSNMLPVMGSSGEITQLDAGISVSQDGVISLNGSEIDKISVFFPHKDAQLKPETSGLYEIVGEYSEADNYKVIQGALEMSNVDVAADMVRLMETTRHIESIQRAITSYDQLMNVGINQIGK